MATAMATNSLSDIDLMVRDLITVLPTVVCFCFFFAMFLHLLFFCAVLRRGGCGRALCCFWRIRGRPQRCAVRFGPHGYGFVCFGQNLAGIKGVSLEELKEILLFQPDPYSLTRNQEPSRTCGRLQH